MTSFSMDVKSHGRCRVNIHFALIFLSLCLSLIFQSTFASKRRHHTHQSLHHEEERPNLHHTHQSLHHGEERPNIYLNEFAVEISGGESVAIALAKRLDFIYQRKMPVLDDWYIFVNRRIQKRSLEKFNRQRHKIKLLTGASEVITVERLKVVKRVKRDAVLLNRSPNDPSWSQMWYMHCGDSNSTFCPCSMRIVDAWRAGYTGEGVVATILDDGIERQHPDLQRNYDPDASLDLNEHDNDPTPRYDVRNENKHGTRCAGVVSAENDNYICSVGVAYGSRIGGVRMLDGEVTDRVEARSLLHAIHHVDIYSSSWGPDDDGTTVEGPGPMAKRAFEKGAKAGRNGLGAIYIWASGNGGHNKDSCSCDGYINSIYTIGVSSVSQYGYRPWYLESCASTLASTYSSGEIYEGKVITTDLRRSCTHQHTGTSASAPMATGVVALMLQANPLLNWRDVQHIIVRTSNSRGLIASDWVENGAGFNVSHVFGFGLLDAAAMTHVANTWRTIPEQRECQGPAQRLVKEIPMHQSLIVSMDTRACYRAANEIAYLEHVVLRLTLSHPRRGDLEIFLTSPSRTVSNILERRNFDRSKVGFRDWEFMTTHHWGENPMGVWHLKITDTKAMMSFRDASRSGQLLSWRLIFYGTYSHPQPDFNFSMCEAYPQDHCHEECVGCCGPTARDCTRCRHVASLRGECIAACESSQFMDPSNQVCQHCWRSCQTCDAEGSHNCTSCYPGFAIVDGACVRTCSQGTYLEPISQTCRICDDVCETCLERSSQCTSCRPGFIFESGTCRPSCRPGTYLVSIKVGCGICNPSCRTCIGSSHNCMSCAEGYVLSGRRCMQVCPESFYPDLRRRSCRRCHSTCRQCNGPRRGNCTMCKRGRTLSRGQCNSACTDDYNKTYVANPCFLVLRFRWCKVSVFKATCCHTCTQFAILTDANNDIMLQNLVVSLSSSTSNDEQFSGESAN